jgi:hypothetical protein
MKNFEKMLFATQIAIIVALVGAFYCIFTHYTPTYATDVYKDSTHRHITLEPKKDGIFGGSISLSGVGDVMALTLTLSPTQTADEVVGVHEVWKYKDREIYASVLDVTDNYVVYYSCGLFAENKQNFLNDYDLVGVGR